LYNDNIVLFAYSAMHHLRERELWTRVLYEGKGEWS
jgi:hypothetical protein